MFREREMYILGRARACVNTEWSHVLLHVGCITLANMIYMY